MSECSLLKATFPNCTVEERPEESVVHIEPTTIEQQSEQYCIVIEDYIQTFGFKTETITESNCSYIKATPV